MKIKKACSQCGSEDVLFDAYARWDYEKQEFVLDDPTFICNSNTLCESCNGECGINETKIEEEI